MLDTLFIFVGAGFGGVSRYWLSHLTSEIFGRQFPYGTLLINVSGCFLVGFFSVILLERLGAHSTPFRSLLLIGFLGGYTTFSTFSLETLNLFKSGATFSAVLNILMSLMLCLLATLLGMLVGREGG